MTFFKLNGETQYINYPFLEFDEFSTTIPDQDSTKLLPVRLGGE